MGWKPIDSVPRDGTAVLLCRAIDADGNRIRWDRRPRTAGVFVQVASYWGADDGWRVYTDQVVEPRLHFEPTHWQPLPVPPES